MLESHGRHVEAADIYLLNGRLVEAIQSCLQVEEDEAAFTHAVNIILDALWKDCPFSVQEQKVLKWETIAAHVLELALNLPQNRLNASDGDQVL